MGICNECGEKTDRYYNLNVIDEKEGSTSFMLDYDEKCWELQLLRWAAQILAKKPNLADYYFEHVGKYSKNNNSDNEGTAKL